MQFPFEARFAELQENMDFYVDRVFERLETEFLVMPRGDGFIEYGVFDTAYEALKSATRSFGDTTPGRSFQRFLKRQWFWWSCVAYWA